MKRTSKSRWLQPAFLLIPFLLSVCFYRTGSWPALAAAVGFLFLLVAILPVCRKHENLWMFLFSSIGLLPANIRIALLSTYWIMDAIFIDTTFFCVTCFLVILHVLFCVEEILLALPVRLAWRRQYKVNVD